MGTAERAELGRLEAAYRRSRGHVGLGDGTRRSLADPSPGAASFATTAPTGTDPGTGADGGAGTGPGGGGPWTGFVHVAPAENDEAGRWEVGLVVAAPDAGRDSVDVADVEATLLEAAARHAAGHGARRVVAWIPGAGPDDDRAAARAGFAPERDLLQMRVRIPPAEAPVWSGGTTVRAYRPGPDDEAWLAVNNRAFEGHPEQGAWTATTLAHHRREPWFDPDGFLLAEDATGLVGFCWTKIHPPADDDPELGEIYVIGVDPARRGLGLGRALVLAGLHSLARRGPATGMLYVDGANRPAVGLYRSLGFVAHRTDRAYGRSSGPAGGPR